MAEAAADFGALDATVQTGRQNDDPAGRAEAELAWAEGAVERMRDKLERAKQDVTAAEQALTDAQNVVKARKRDLASAKKAGG